MEPKVLRFILFGGVFDPIHRGHLAVAHELLRRYPDLERILFIPAGRPPHKRLPEAPPWVRYALLVSVIWKEPRCLVWDREIRVYPDVAYTLDTIEAFHQWQGTRPSEVAFVVGADAFLKFHTWYRAEKLPRVASWIILSRPPVTEMELQQYLESHFSGLSLVSPHSLLNRNQPAVTFIRDFSIDISSTAVRQNIKKGEPFEHLVPPVVAALIHRHGWYRGRHTGGRA